MTSQITTRIDRRVSQPLYEHQSICPEPRQFSGHLAGQGRIVFRNISQNGSKATHVGQSDSRKQKGAKQLRRSNTLEARYSSKMRTHDKENGPFLAQRTLKGSSGTIQQKRDHKIA